MIPDSSPPEGILLQAAALCAGQSGGGLHLQRGPGEIPRHQMCWPRDASDAHRQ